MLPPPPRSTLFAYTTLFRSRRKWPLATRCMGYRSAYRCCTVAEWKLPLVSSDERWSRPHVCHGGRSDRKSTRLNSSHEWISYAVFCLKKKNKRRKTQITEHT